VGVWSVVWVCSVGVWSVVWVCICVVQVCRYAMSVCRCAVWVCVNVMWVCRCKKSSPSVKSVQQSRDILLSVMSHDVDTVRLRAYQNVYNIVKVTTSAVCWRSLESRTMSRVCFLLTGNIVK